MITVIKSAGWRTSRAGTAALFASLFLAVASAFSAERPNLVFIYTDDQGAWTTGASGNPDARTPHIDRLAAEGVTFPNAFVVTPVCSPARVTVLTGRYAGEAGIWDHLNPRVEPELGLPPERFPTWSKRLRQAGYRMGLFGKWHLGTEEEFHPRHFGFETFFGFLQGGIRPENPELEEAGVVAVRTGFMEDLLVDRALDFIRTHREDPFFVAVHTRAPHRPFLPVPPQDWEPFADLDPKLPDPDYPGLDVARVKKDLREYLASVAQIDRNVGRLLDVLDELQLADNTVVIYTSDHGYHLGQHGMWGKGNGRHMLLEPPPGTAHIPAGTRPNMYDHSLRVPLIIRWPARAPAGALVARTTTNLDWFPTFLELAGIDGVPAALRGRSLAPLLLGETPASWDDSFYGEYSMQHGGRADMRMFRTPEWKLVRDFLDPERDELYHLAADPEEMHNLIGSADPAVQAARQRLEAEILRHMRELNDPVLSLVREF